MKIHRPGDEGYDEQRRPLRPDLDPRPAMVAEAFNAGDVLGDTSRTQSAYTPENHRRLREVKRFYDPGNLFGHNHNIAPAGTRSRALVAA